ncbi:MAG: hypothetical protein KGI98_13300 [Euryarchaeota archaeon]|nr:hypothetical protein [Euryarchaeota archaeon]
MMLSESSGSELTELLPERSFLSSRDQRSHRGPEGTVAASRKVGGWVELEQEFLRLARGGAAPLRIYPRGRTGAAPQDDGASVPVPPGVNAFDYLEELFGRLWSPEEHSPVQLEESERKAIASIAKGDEGDLDLDEDLRSYLVEALMDAESLAH